MIFAKVDVDLSDHVKAVEAGSAMGTWLWALLYSRKHELDGHVPLAAMRLAWVGQIVAHEHAEHLVAVGLWKQTKTGFQILNYESKNDTKADIDERRKIDRKRKRSVRSESARSPSGIHSESDGIPNVTTVGIPGSGSGSVPDPEGIQGEAPSGVRLRQPGAFGMELETYRVGVSDGAGTPIAAFDRFALDDITRGINAHAPKFETSEQLLAWLRASAADFARAYRAILGTSFHPGYLPKKWVQWLDKGKPIAVAGHAHRPDPPPGPSRRPIPPLPAKGAA